MVGLLVGCLAAAGLRLSLRRHPAPVLAKANDSASPKHGVPERSRGARAAPRLAKRTPSARSSVTPGRGLGGGVEGAYAHGTELRAISLSGAPPNESVPPGTGSSRPAVDLPVGWSVIAQTPGSQLPTGGRRPLSQGDAVDLGYPGSAQLGGFRGALPPIFVGGASVSVGVPQDVTEPSYDTTLQGTGQQADAGATPGTSTGTNPRSDNSDGSGEGSDPPAVPAPELEPATLGAAMTLLLGSLAVLGSRRLRVRI